MKYDFQTQTNTNEYSDYFIDKNNMNFENYNFNVLRPYERGSGPYDGLPWHGIIPPPTYDDLNNTKITTTINSFYTDDVYDFVQYAKVIDTNECGHTSSKVISPQEIYDENKTLKKECDELKNMVESLKSEIKSLKKENQNDDTPEWLKRIANALLQ